MENTGTPKDLKEAILNGIREFSNNMDFDSTTLDVYIRRSVKDFLANNFTPYTLSSISPEDQDRLFALFEKCTK